MADNEPTVCPNCGKKTLIEQSGMTFCMSCQQFGGPVVEDFETMVDQHVAEAQAASMASADSEESKTLNSVLTGWERPDDAEELYRQLRRDDVTMAVLVKPAENALTLKVVNTQTQEGPAMDMQYGQPENLAGLLKMVVERQDKLTPDNALETLTGQKADAQSSNT